MNALETIIATIFAELADANNTRNWLIAFDIRNGVPMIVYSGRPCHASKSITCGRLSDFAEVHRHWFYFSHKAPYIEALNLLKKEIEKA